MPGKGAGKKSGYNSGGRRGDLERSASASGQKAKSGYYGTYDPNKGKLQEAQALSFLSGLPLIGGIFNGYQQARYMDDYYKNTGMVPTYPGYTMSGYSGFGRAAGNLALSAASNLGGSVGYNVKEGTKDLLTFYNYAYA